MQSRFSAHQDVSGAVDRRTFLTAGGLGFCGLGLAGLAEGARASDGAGKAKSTILIFLCGGASHIDTWDMKPDAPAEIRGDFKPIATTAPGIQLCEHLPKLSKQAHHLAIVRSLGHYGRGNGDHHGGYYYNLTGHAPDATFRTLRNNRKPYETDWPYIGASVGYKAPKHPYLPQTITLPQMPGAPRYTRPGQFAARLGVVHDPLYINGNIDKPLEFTVPALALQGDMTAQRLQSRQSLLGALNQARHSIDRTKAVDTFGRQQQRALGLLAGSRATNAFDVSRESEATREKYGQTVNGMSMLLARRLVEAEVPFVGIFWKENPKWKGPCKSAGGWDTHGNNFNCLKDRLLPEFDQSFSALVEDLHQRGLLDQTLVMVTSEMGRKPKIGDPRSGGKKGAGRDHWLHCMSTVFAGGGMRGGQAYGTSDAHAAYPADLAVAPEDITKTVYYAMGITDLSATDRSGQRISLMEEGRVIGGLF